MRRMVRAHAPSVSATNETERRDSQMAGNTPKKNRTEQTVAEQNLVDGLHKHASLITSLMIGGVAGAFGPGPPAEARGVLGRTRTVISLRGGARDPSPPSPHRAGAWRWTLSCVGLYLARR